MLKSKELRAKAWESLKGKYWMAFIVTIVAGLIASVGNSFISFGQSLSEILGMVDPAELDTQMMIGAIVLNGVVITAAIIGFVLSLLITSPLTVGLCNYYIKNTNSKPSFGELFSGFKTKYGRNVGTLFLAGVKLVLWTLLFVVPGIIKSFEYSIIPYILADNPELSSKEVFKKAKQIMTGNKWRLFKLEFSFIGWFILCCLTLGLGTFFLLPYINAATAEFYAEIKNN